MNQPDLFVKKSQTERVLEMLREGDKLTGDFCKAFMGPSFRTRISELNRKGRAVITSVRFNAGNYLYHLERENGTTAKPLG